MNLFRAKALFDIAAGEMFHVDLDRAETVPTSAIGQTFGRGQMTGLIDSDAVNHPSHYNSGKIEVIEFIEDQKLQYHLGNTVKYIARAGKKDPSKELEDLQKAAWYLARRIENLTAEREGRSVKRPNDMVKK